MGSEPEKTLIAIDPGPKMSACVLMRGMVVTDFDFRPNDEIAESLDFGIQGSPTLIVEAMVNYGMPAGDDIRETLIWMGRFQQANGGQMERITNSRIRAQICKSMKAKDSHIRQALIDRYGGQAVAIGRKPKNKKDKSTPGPLYGMKQNQHHWSALAVGVAWLELKQEPPDA